MSLLDKAQTVFQRIRGGGGGNPTGQPSEESMYSRRNDGSLAGYHPNAVRQQQQPVQEQQLLPATEQPGDTWLQPSYSQESTAIQSAGQPQVTDAYHYQQNYQQNFQQNYQQNYQQGFQQGYQQGYQQNWAQPPQDQSQMGYQQQPPMQSNGYQLPAFPQPQGNINTATSPFVGYNPQGFQQQQQSTQLVPAQTQPQQTVSDNISYLPGHIIGKDGREYIHRVRVAQVKTISDCYPLMECMRNNESVVVNLDALQDTAEIDRCLDLLYGACYALQCQFNEVSTRNVYMLTPGVVDVEPAEEMRRMNEFVIDSRWPDPNSLAYRQRASSREQSTYGNYSQSSYGQSSYGQSSGYGQSGYSDYTPDYQSYGGMGRRTASNRSANDEYSDFGGFPNAGRF